MADELSRRILEACERDGHVLEPRLYGERVDDAEHEGLSTEEVRRKWPRRHCRACGAACYDSFSHYVSGDW